MIRVNASLLYCDEFLIAIRKVIYASVYGVKTVRRILESAMKATIFHNPACGTSRKTLAILEEALGVEVEVIEYLSTPPSRERLAALYARAGMTPHEGLRIRGTEAAAMGLLDADGDTIIDAMLTTPILIERPLVETEKGVRLCRPQELVFEIL